MRAFVTGATGFIGAHVARKLSERGDQVVALVRSPDKATALREQGAELIEGDLADAEAVFHVGAVYKVGIPKKDREGMYDANVRGTERVLDAAHEAGVPRVLYVS